MEYLDFKIYNVDPDYLKYLNSVDGEVMYSETEDYRKKPFLGILITVNGNKYVIPLTSAKNKHKNWKDKSDKHFRIYEISDSRKRPRGIDEITVDLTNREKDKLIESGVREDQIRYYNKRIISILMIGKMIPVDESVITKRELKLNPELDSKEYKRRELENKEYLYCLTVKEDILETADKLYNKTIIKGKPIKYCCNFPLLEDRLSSYLSIYDFAF